MKCPICGSTNNEGAAFCSNCGSALKNETSGYMDAVDTSDLNNNNGFGKRNTQSFQQQSAQYQQPNPQQGAQGYGNGYQQGVPNQNMNYGNDIGQQQFANNFSPYAAAAPAKKRSGQKAIYSIIVAVVCFLIGFGINYYKNNVATKTMSGTGYTIELPNSMKKSSSQSLFSLDSFQNKEVAINTVKLDYSDLEVYGYGKGMKPKELFDFILANSTSSLNVIRTDDNYVYYTQTLGSKHYYGMSAMREGNDGYYVFDFLCDKNDRSKYEDKFKEWAETITVK